MALEALVQIRLVDELVKGIELELKIIEGLADGDPAVRIVVATLEGLDEVIDGVGIISEDVEIVANNLLGENWVGAVLVLVLAMLLGLPLLLGPLLLRLLLLLRLDMPRGLDMLDRIRVTRPDRGLGANRLGPDNRNLDVFLPTMLTRLFVGKAQGHGSQDGGSKGKETHGDDVSIPEMRGKKVRIDERCRKTNEKRM